MVILGSALSPMTIDEHMQSSSSLGAVRVDEMDHYEGKKAFFDQLELPI
jgi:hypothetical protein